jgi:hypothetical protein
MPKSEIARIRVRLSLACLTCWDSSHVDARASLRELSDRIAVRLAHTSPHVDVDVTVDPQSDVATRIEVVDADWCEVADSSDAVRGIVDAAWSDLESWIVPAGCRACHESDASPDCRGYCHPCAVEIEVVS